LIFFFRGGDHRDSQKLKTWVNWNFDSIQFFFLFVFHRCLTNLWVFFFFIEKGLLVLFYFLFLLVHCWFVVFNLFWALKWRESGILFVIYFI